ncbi:MAG: ATP phosphoribosyltransferase [Spirochaetaceae bacterium]|jgi:ATP phosphoribosyltransferase|nr:ATP phosphoribosyltransferase [Spirochaetaceae bacterium]
MALRILIPKGRIYDNVAQLFNDAGFQISLSDRAYRPSVSVDWLNVKIMKPQNVGDLLELGSHDAGFTGADWIEESGADVETILDLGFDKVSIVAAIPAGITLEALAKRQIVAATEYVNIAERYLRSKNFKFKIVRTYGATEVFPPDDADMIIDNAASGKTLRDNGLEIIDTITKSSTLFVASKAAMRDSEKRGRIEELAMLFKAVLDGRERAMLEMNVSAENYEALVAALPAMRSPTVSPLYGKGGVPAGYAVKIAIKRDEVSALLPRVKLMGATDIVEYDLRKVIP